MGGIWKNVNNINYTREDIESGRVKITIEVPNDRFESIRDKVLKRLAPTVSIQGFRPGKAPKNVLIAQLGPTLYEQTLNDLIPQVTLEVIQHEKLLPLDQITYAVEKIAEGSGVKFNASFSILPEFDLPNLSKIKVKKEEVEVSDEEISTVIKQMHEDHKKKSKSDQKQVKMDDNWAESLQLGVKSMKELEERVKGELTRQKQTMQQNKYIDDIIRQMIEKSSFSVPQTLIDQEVTRREQEYTKRIEQLGMKLEEFLKSQKTTMGTLRKDWKKASAEQLKAEIILMRVAQEYNISATDEDVDAQIKQLKDERLKQQYQSPEAKRRLKNIILRQKIISRIIELVEGKNS
jgi:FKBP-type peptidyl-prolyl cis-trans isomerase (trigger factor)